jgi:TonB family protein
MKSRFEHISQPRRLVTMRRHRFALFGAIALVIMITALPLPSCVKESETPTPEMRETTEVAQVPDPPEAPGEGAITPPVLLEEEMVLPEYPEAEREARIEGKVLLQTQVLKDGTVGEITVVEGVEGHPGMEESAMEALSQCTFRPATQDGKPVSMTIQIPIAFRLDDDKKPGSQEKADETLPQLITESIVKPEYPEEARDAGVTGVMLVEAEVLPDGTPGKITVKEGIAGYPGFDQAAIEAVRQWRFTPGTLNGEPVKAKVMIPLEFDLDDEK